MKRLKLKYSVNEITNNLYTFGKEWMTENDVEYIGLYHTYTTSEVYTRPVWDEQLSVKLVAYTDIATSIYKYNKLKPNIKATHTSIQPHQVIVSAAEYKTGYITRYFAKKRNENLIIEVNASQYADWDSGKIDNVLYDMTQIKWQVSGNIDDTVGVVNTIGVKTKNKQVVQLAEKKLPGISLKLSNYTQYYADTIVVVPKDINA
jgi:hypothetical protein